jgi:UDP-N-acetylglucosamine transferase subunit ALG13
MIFVILGTQDKSFIRLLEVIEKSNINDEIIVQSGFTKFESNKMKIFDYVDMKDFNDYIKRADLIISHGGVGTIMNALANKKKVIACARLSKYGEHQNDHQLQLIKPLKDSGYIMELEDKADIDKLMEKIDLFEPKEYVSNNEKFIGILTDFINKT